MVRITNLGEAIESVSALSEFLTKFNETLGVLGNMASKSSSEVRHQPIPQPVVVNKAGHTDVPTSWGARALEILKEAGKPLSPTEMVSIYRAKGWPGSDGDERKLYTALLSGAYYMFKQNRLLRQNGKYSLSNKTISPGVVAPGEDKT